MKLHSAPRTLGTLLCLGFPLVPLQAAALALVSDGRHVDSRYWSEADDVIINAHLVPDAPFAPFAAGAEQAAQSSAMALSNGGLTMTWTAGGRAEGTYFDGGGDLRWGGSGNSVFSIGFRIDGEATVELNGLVTGDVFGAGFAFLFDAQGDELYSAFSDTDRDEVSFQGVLPAGEYWVEATAGASGANTGGGARNQATLRPIPEPATSGLLALGLGALSVQRARKSNAAQSQRAESDRWREVWWSDW